MVWKMYEARKHAHGGTCANQYTVQSDQSDHTAESKNRMAQNEPTGKDGID